MSLIRAESLPIWHAHHLETRAIWEFISSFRPFSRLFDRWESTKILIAPLEISLVFCVHPSGYSPTRHLISPSSFSVYHSLIRNEPIFSSFSSSGLLSNNQISLSRLSTSIFLSVFCLVLYSAPDWIVTLSLLSLTRALKTLPNQFYGLRF